MIRSFHRFFRCVKLFDALRVAGCGVRVAGCGKTGYGLRGAGYGVRVLKENK